MASDVNQILVLRRYIVKTGEVDDGFFLELRIFSRIDQYLVCRFLRNKSQPSHICAELAQPG